MIIKTLLAEGYSFVVMRYRSSIRGIQITNLEFEVFALRSDYRKLKKQGFQIRNATNGFTRRDSNPESLISRDLDREEIAEFHHILSEEPHLFKVVVSKGDDRMWELKGDSLKSHLKPLELCF